MIAWLFQRLKAFSSFSPVCRPFLSERANMVKHYVTSFTKLIGQFSFSSCSKYGTCENEKLQASIKTNIGELHVSTPYEFLVWH